MIKNKTLKDLLFVISGSFLVATAYVIFNRPNDIVPGGVYGLSIIINHLTKGVFEYFPNGLPMGATALVFNIPLLFLAHRFLGSGAGYKTVVTFLSTAVFVDLLTYLQAGRVIIENDPLLAAIYGGALIGLGVTLIFKAKATSAGTDVLSKILAKYTKMQVGVTIMIVDSIIVILGLVAFGKWTVPLYSWITIFVYGKVVDYIQYGLGLEKAAFIISNKSEELKDVVLCKMQRGGTFFHGRGMYNGEEKEIIYVVLPSREVQLLREKVSEVDPKAFISILPAHEILGEGFKPIQIDKFND